MTKLNIGCGPNVFPFPGWVNYDREVDSVLSYLGSLKRSSFNGLNEGQLRLALYLQDGQKIDIREHDIRSGFPQHEESSVDAIYLGQVIEHLNPIYEVPNLLRECWRMLKPGGVLRITTPDLDLLIDAYRLGQMDRFNDDQPAFYREFDQSGKLALIMYGAAGPNCTWSNYEGHMFLFTRKSMSDFVRKAGFSDEPVFDAVVSRDSSLATEVVDAGLSHSFITEVAK
jgi:predicted SAM-dependent methyltransferase